MKHNERNKIKIIITLIVITIVNNKRKKCRLAHENLKEPAC